jgi:hypothetical protein
LPAIADRRRSRLGWIGSRRAWPTGTCRPGRTCPALRGARFQQSLESRERCVEKVALVRDARSARLSTASRAHHSRRRSHCRSARRPYNDPVVRQGPRSSGNQRR